ncbi:hypothetical protein CDL15_Pgr007770 [Punica granatum]|uniref:Uncharacterized protein n=1 Tax=Punica granatum TaxID=22663 RepID=A0A218XBK4_PUNGR|nr:hypothetical protein CDL15_Pgr007770 [Punica granatum]PKI34511.1 hypothetical protein CRG98_045048 [Punica granatum]
MTSKVLAWSPWTGTYEGLTSIENSRASKAWDPSMLVDSSGSNPLEEASMGSNPEGWSPSRAQGSRDPEDHEGGRASQALMPQRLYVLVGSKVEEINSSCPQLRRSTWPSD